MGADGFPVVLTADRILTADHRLLFDGMGAASLTTTTPRPLFDALMAPQPGGAGVRAPLAPLGLRRVEAALLEGGFAAEQVAVVAEHRLDQAIGPATRVIGLSTGDPDGRGMNSTTMQAIMGGQPWTRACFRRLLARVLRLRDRRAPAARVVVGGPGAWQIAAAPPAGVERVVVGECETSVAALVRALVEGREPPAVGAPCPAAAVPRLRGASTFGAVELGRGCGWGCRFCTIAGVPMRHFAPETVEADVAFNLAAGQRHPALLSEDCFRYGAAGGRIDAAPLLALLERLRRLPGLGVMQVDHANLASVARWSDGELADLRRLLGAPQPWINVGVESVDGALLAGLASPAKLGGHPPAAWADFAAEGLRRLSAAGFLPFASLVLGLPGETPATIAATAAWAERRAAAGVCVFPMLLAPVDGAPAPVLRRAHWRLLDACWRRSFRLLPRLYAGQQRAAGVGWTRRALIAGLGRGQALQWRGLMAWHAWRAPV